MRFFSNIVLTKNEEVYYVNMHQGPALLLGNPMPSVFQFSTSKSNNTCYVFCIFSLEFGVYCLVLWEYLLSRVFTRETS